MATAMKCDLCGKFETGSPYKLTVEHTAILHDICSACLIKLEALITKIGKGASDENTETNG